jgi:hypothetical protein
MLNPVRPITIPIFQLERSDICSRTGCFPYMIRRVFQQIFRQIIHKLSIYIFTLCTQCITLFSKAYN